MVIRKNKTISNDYTTNHDTALHWLVDGSFVEFKSSIDDTHTIFCMHIEIYDIDGNVILFEDFFKLKGIFTRIN